MHLNENSMVSVADFQFDNKPGAIFFDVLTKRRPPAISVKIFDSEDASTQPPHIHFAGNIRLAVPSVNNYLIQVARRSCYASLAVRVLFFCQRGICGRQKGGKLNLGPISLSESVRLAVSATLWVHAAPSSTCR